MPAPVESRLNDEHVEYRLERKLQDLRKTQKITTPEYANRLERPIRNYNYYFRRLGRQYGR